jgi:hypothetical protein
MIALYVCAYWLVAVAWGAIVAHAIRANETVAPAVFGLAWPATLPIGLTAAAISWVGRMLRRKR